VNISLAKSRRPLRLAKNERGYMLLTLLFFLTLMIIAMAASVPYAKVAIKRDKEQELIHRGTQYARAIGRYYKRFGRYPASLEQLENTNNMRFLRKRYKDPMTGKDDWTIIHFGEAQMRTSGLNGPGTSNPTGVGTPAASLNTPSSAGPSLSSAGSSAGQTDTSNPMGTAGTRNNPGGRSGQRFGGGAIVGVASSKEEESIKELNGKNHYNDWQFVYDPTQDPTARGRTGIPGQQGITGATPTGQPVLTGPGISPQGGPTGPGTMGGPGTTTTPK
jgi:type II secretory pathway pseudopilin PulG